MVKKKWAPVTVITFIILTIFAIMCLYPLLWLIVNSFKTNANLFEDPWGLPLIWALDNYVRAIVTGNIGQSFMNSIYITLISTVVAVLLSAMTSYAVVRMDWKLASPTRAFFLLGMSIPAYAAIVPLFSILNRMGLLGSYWGVILAHIVFAFPISIFILSGFLSTIPRELEEAAVMDGCSVLTLFFKIIMPISVSSIVTVAVIDFVSIWNDLLFPQIFLSDPNKMPLPVGLNSFADLDSVDYAGMLAAIVFTVIPTIFVYSILHEKIIEGMSAGAVKG